MLRDRPGPCADLVLRVVLLEGDQDLRRGPGVALDPALGDHARLDRARELARLVARGAARLIAEKRPRRERRPPVFVQEREGRGENQDRGEGGRSALARPAFAQPTRGPGAQLLACCDRARLPHRYWSLTSSLPTVAPLSWASCAAAVSASPKL